MSKVTGYAAQSATSPLGPFGFERREPGPTRRRDRHPLLRRLPLRPPPGAQRVGRHRLPDGAGPRDRRPRHAAWARRCTELKAGDLAGVGCMVDSCRTCPTCQRGPRAVLRERRHLHLQRPETRPAGIDLRRLLEPHRRRRGLRAEGVADSSTSPARRAAAVRRASPPTRRCATGRSARAARSASSASAAWATWGSSSPTRWAPRSPCSPPRRARRPTPAGWAPTTFVLSTDAGDVEAPAGQLRLHPRHGLRAARPQRLPRRC